MNRMQITIRPQLGAFLQIGHMNWGAPLEVDHREPWFRYLSEHVTVRTGNVTLRDLPPHLQGQALRIWRTNNPRSVAALFRRCAPDYRADNDPWGQAMAVHFDVAAWLHLREGTVVDGYRPGAGGSVCESEEIADELERAGVDMAEELSRFCARLTRILQRAGRDY